MESTFKGFEWIFGPKLGGENRAKTGQDRPRQGKTGLRQAKTRQDKTKTRTKRRQRQRQTDGHRKGQSESDTRLNRGLIGRSRRVRGGETIVEHCRVSGDSRTMKTVSCL